MLTPDYNRRPEVADLLKVPDVKSHVNRRRWKLKMASVLKKLSPLTSLWHAFMTILTSLMFFKTSKKVDAMETDQSRVTPEPITSVGKGVPNILLNDASFSDGMLHLGILVNMNRETSMNLTIMVTTTTNVPFAVL